VPFPDREGKVVDNEIASSRLSSDNPPGKSTSI
jgi:hypothetical protein